MNVLVVDSGSTDGTPEKVEAAQAADPGFPLVLLREPRREGKVSALRAAFSIKSSDGMA